MTEPTPTALPEPERPDILHALCRALIVQQAPQQATQATARRPPTHQGAAMSDDTLYCPKCGSTEVTVTAEQKFMVNTGEHYCHSVKTQDHDAKASCLACQWEGERHHLEGHP